MKRSEVTKSLDNYPSFLADSMLGSLARKLRIIGYDTLYLRDADDSEIIESALRTGRVILTSDKMLYHTALSRGAESILLKGNSDGRNLLEIRKWALSRGIDLRTDNTRCSICNSELFKVKKSEVAGSVPLDILRRHREFYLCRGCGKVYWRGSHWKRLRNIIYAFKRM